MIGPGTTALMPSEKVLHRCQQLGFASAGICAAAPADRPAAWRDWLAAGKQGEMEYLLRDLEVRLDPRNLLDGARSIICVADRHAGGPDVAGSEAEGRIARYARGEDYHRVMKKRLHELADELAAEFPEHRFRVCVDTAPLLEREHAERAGLGALGKHTLLIERGVGSYLLLGAIVTSLPLTPTEPSDPDPCGSCSRCIDACPTQAISPWSVDATRCISYLTIEHRSLIDECFHGPIGDWIFGCDICQEVCPHNQPTERSRAAPVHPAYAPRHQAFDLLEVLGWREEDRRRVFTRSALKRAKLSMMKRNAIIAAANATHASNRVELHARIESLARDPQEDPLVRRTAEAVLRGWER